MKKLTLAQIKELAQSSRVDLFCAAQGAEYKRPMIYLHWSAGHYGQPFPDYHFNVDQDGTIFTGITSLAERLAHTWKRNTGSIGIAFLCAYNCVCRSSDPQGPQDIDYGPEPPTAEQIEAVAQLIAVLCEALGIPCDEKYVRTHGEQADIDGYGIGSDDPELRWDLLYLPGFEEPGGKLLRGKANFYIKGGI